MTATLLTLLAAKAKATALVAAAVGVTAAVGGGTVAIQAVSDSSEITADVTATETTGPGAGPEVEVPADDTESGGEVPAPDAEAPDAEAPDADPEAAPVEDVPAIVSFTCDPSNNHGQNVSAYARSLPKGPGRGALVSQVAQSDCGKKAAAQGEESTEDADAPDDTETPQAPEAEAPETPEADEPESDEPEADEPEADEPESDESAADHGQSKTAPAPKKDASPSGARGKGSAKGKRG